MKLFIGWTLFWAVALVAGLSAEPVYNKVVAYEADKERRQALQIEQRTHAIKNCYGHEGCYITPDDLAFLRQQEEILL